MSKTTETAQEKVRVYILAKELKLETKDLLVICQELGFAGIKNQLSGLEADQVGALKKRVKDGPKQAAPTRPTPPVPAVGGPPKSLDSRVRTLPPAKPKAPAPVAPPPVEPEPVAPAAVVESPAAPAPVQPVAVAPPPAEPEAVVVTAPEPVAEVVAPVAMPEPEPVVVPVAVAPPVPSEPQPPPLPTSPPPASVMPATGVPGMRGMPNLNPNRPRPITGAGGRAATHGPSQPRPTQATPLAASTNPTPAPAPAAPTPPAAPSANPNPPRVAPPSSGTGPVRPLPSTGSPPPAGARPPLPSGNPQAPVRSRTPTFGPDGRIPQGQGHGPNRVAPPPAGGKAPPPVANKTNSIKLTPEQIKKMREMEQRRGGKISIQDIAKQVTQTAPPADGAAPPAADKATDRRSPLPRPGANTGGKPTAAEEEEAKKKSAGGVIGRDGRHAARASRDRRGSGPTDKGSVIMGPGGSVDLIEQQSGSRKGPRAALMAKMKRRGAQLIIKKEGPVEITLPITVRTLSEAIGVKLGDLSKQLLKETQQLYGAASVIEFDVAELIAINKGITLVQKTVKSAKDLLLERYKAQAETVDPDKLRPRPPIVVIMGHVDHGKTSLLDKIRIQYGLASDVVSTEAGGITQVLRAWRVEKDGKPVTFLDTPGHEAFTKMRARGANVTDIAVIVVAATDGVMPQTEEAIAHARAADVDIIVAINKIDMPNANLDKTRRQLYQLNLLPDNMGGEIQFVETSAVTGQGVGELLDAIGIVAELSDPPLMADPEHKPSGTCLEAYMDGDRGVMATLLVQQGTLHKGDVILCGATSGRVRAMYDDLGRPVEEAGPSTPVKVFGLNEVPDADDPFYFVEDLTEAAGIAEKERVLNRERSLASVGPKSLDQLKEAHARAKITELKVILKAEARGSVEAIKKELEKLIHDEVRCRVLSSGIGAISESDVTLALTSPADTLVIGFNVTADDEALRLAEARGISLREYQIIYNLVDDVKAALEGRLKPIEEVVHLGRAIVRDTFKVSKVGTIAGCYVTSGVIERSAKVRIIRGGVIVYPPAERVASLDSLKRFKDDAKDVREGFECGMKIAGFDDVKVDDVIEAYRIEIKQRTL